MFAMGEQIICCFILNLINQKSSNPTLLQLKLQPVSYTHLDVYKRQHTHTHTHINIAFFNSVLHYSETQDINYDHIEM